MKFADIDILSNRLHILYNNQVILLVTQFIFQLLNL
jgi:hypothetical protein